MSNRTGSMIIALVFFFLTGTFVNAQDITQKVVPGRVNSPEQQNKPYVILVSADGFRYDYAEKYNAQNLLRLSSQGVSASSMTPSFPSLTFPNHYTIATGLYPAHHGLVDNNFWDPARQRKYSMGNKKESYDSSWYGGTPLWVLAEHQQMLSASFYWVGSEVAVQGVRPTYYYNYTEAIPMDERLIAVKDWLQLPADKRPHIITFYFPEVDHAGHDHGPDSKEVEEAVHFVDASMGRMQSMLDSLNLPVNLIFVSDHGMVGVDTVNTLKLPVVDTNQVVMSPSDVLIHIYAKDPSYIQPTYEKLKAQATDYDVYLATETPSHWHYGASDDQYKRIGDIVIVPRYPKIFAWGTRRVFPGRHGYDPRLVKEMQATFMAWGPQFKKGKQIGSFENVHIYELVARLLGLKIETPTDSKRRVLKKIIR